MPSVDPLHGGCATCPFRRHDGVPDRGCHRALAALTAALAGRRAAADGGDAAFVDADIALHTAVVAAAHNPVLSALFTEFVPTLRKGLIDMLELLGLRSGDPNHGDESHAALVDAVARGDADAAAHTLREELEQTLTRLTSL
ncbi:FadR family transcriptional regulator [Streptomyces sp. gb1(2016)]|uniref:FadR family transcriptional regulator n=1 Tax=Streptomyces sp. gb1(2016) TaxID=1828321 RepID=A0A652L5X8_9ACTN|nr:FadR family transcriptional regulator [Streptomyces sp. gb1(2016)]